MLRKMARYRVWLALLTCVSAGVFTRQAIPAQANQYTNMGYSLALTYTGSTTIPRGGSTGKFVAYLNHPLGISSNFSRVMLLMDKRESLAGSPFPLSLFQEQDSFPQFSQFTGGQHHFQAQYYVFATSSWIYSNVITVTVAKSNAGDTTCFVHNFAYTYGAGQSITLDLEIDAENGIVDWQNGTFSAFFTGPSSVTYTKLRPNAHEQVNIFVPQKPGAYQLGCRFDGSASFNASHNYSILPIRVTSVHQAGGKNHLTTNQIGGIALYTNPTTINGDEMVTWYVIVYAGRGLPVPSGTINIISGLGTDAGIHLSANGTALVKFTTYSIFDPISIIYFGDDTYAAYTQKFSLKNPPIPRS